MKTYRVQHEVRKQGAIGVWTLSNWLTVEAHNQAEALEKARELLYAEGLEVRFPAHCRVVEEGGAA